MPDTLEMICSEIADDTVNRRRQIEWTCPTCQAVRVTDLGPLAGSPRILKHRALCDQCVDALCHRVRSSFRRSVVAMSLLILLGLTASAAEPKTRIVFIGHSTCEPCKLSKKETIPELQRRGFDVLVFDGDQPNVASLFKPAAYPTWIALDAAPRYEEHPASADLLLRELGLLAPAAGLPQKREQTGGTLSAPPPNLPALFRQYFGEQCSIEITIPHGREIPLGEAVLLLPELTRFDCSLGFDPKTKAERVLITFEKPVPRARKSLTITDVTADLPTVTITGNRVSATADIGLGLQKTLTLEVKELPW